MLITFMHPKTKERITLEGKADPVNGDWTVVEEDLRNVIKSSKLNVQMSDRYISATVGKEDLRRHAIILWPTCEVRIAWNGRRQFSGSYLMPEGWNAVNRGGGNNLYLTRCFIRFSDRKVEIIERRDEGDGPRWYMTEYGSGDPKRTGPYGSFFEPMEETAWTNRHL